MKLIGYAFEGFTPTAAEWNVITDAMAFWEDETSNVVQFGGGKGPTLKFRRGPSEGDHWVTAVLGEGVILHPSWFEPKILNRIGWRARQFNAAAHAIGHYLMDDTWHSPSTFSVMGKDPGFWPWRLGVDGHVGNEIIQMQVYEKGTTT